MVVAGSYTLLLLWFLARNSSAYCYPRTDEAGNTVLCGNQGTCNSQGFCDCHPFVAYELSSGKSSQQVSNASCSGNLRTASASGLFAAGRWWIFSLSAAIASLAVRSLYMLRVIRKLRLNLQTVATLCIFVYAFLNAIYFAVDPWYTYNILSAAASAWLSSIPDPFVTSAYNLLFLYLRDLCTSDTRLQRTNRFASGPGAVSAAGVSLAILMITCIVGVLTPSGLGVDIYLGYYMVYLTVFSAYFGYYCWKLTQIVGGGQPGHSSAAQKPRAGTGTVSREADFTKRMTKLAAFSILLCGGVVLAMIMLVIFETTNGLTANKVLVAIFVQRSLVEFWAALLLYTFWPRSDASAKVVPDPGLPTNIKKGRAPTIPSQSSPQTAATVEVDATTLGGGLVIVESAASPPQAVVALSVNPPREAPRSGWQ